MALLPDDPQQRKLVLLGAVVVLAAAYFGHGSIYRPRADEIVALQERVDRLDTQNRTARALANDASRAQVEARLAGFREQLGKVEGLIPSSEELPDLLDAISAEATQTGVELALIQPVGATAEAYYTRRTYDLAVLGSYHRIGAFLTEIASLPRIITPINLNLTVRSDSASAEPQLEAKFAIETYVLPGPDAPAPDTTRAAAGNASDPAAR